MERIVCAAIWYKDLPLKKPEALEPRGFRPQGVDRGIVFFGLNHMHCLYQMVAISGLRAAECGEYVHGFLTTENRFVERIEGAGIALGCGQIEKLNYSKTKLFSEDLY
jgi:hypothetical protein